jgi:hypothetical protein
MRVPAAVPQLVVALAVVALGGCFRCDCGGRGGPACDPAACAPGEECDPATDACGPVSCIPGTTRCSPTEDGVVEQCNATGDGWTVLVFCSPAQTCAESPGVAFCTPPLCPPGDSYCEPDGTIVVCQAGTKAAPRPCPAGEVCDPALGGTCMPTSCTPGELICVDADPAQVETCNPFGTGAGVTETCAAEEVCAAGACVTRCELAAETPGAVGCLFYALDTDNTTYDDALQYDVAIGNPSATRTASVSIEVRSGAGGPWMTVAAQTVAPGNVWLIVLPDRHVEDSAIAVALAYRVTSDEPVVAWQFNSDDLNGASSSSGATLLMPAHVLGLAHYALGLPMAANPYTVELNRAGVAVVATLDGTSVTVTSSTTMVGAPGLPPLAAGDIASVVLNEGDVLQLETADFGDDVTGTRIDSDQPVAVFAFSEAAAPSGQTLDHYEEQLLPVALWGTEYIAMRAWNYSEPALWRLIAAEDNTTITFDYTAGVSGLPSPPGSGVVLNAGEWAEWSVAGPDLPGFTAGPGQIGDFRVYADKPIGVASWTLDETNMVLSIPVELWGDAQVFLTPPFFENAGNFASNTAGNLFLDGILILAADTTPLPVPFFEYRVPLTDNGLHEAHILDGALDRGLMTYVSGNAGPCAFAYGAGFGPLVPF